MGEIGLNELIAKLSRERLCPGKCGRKVFGPVKCDECYTRDSYRDAKLSLDEVAQRIPIRFRSFRFDSDDFVQRCGPELQALRSCPTQTVTLRGKAGAGKTSAAAALANEILSRGVDGGRDAFARALGLRWYSAHDLSQARVVHGSGRGESPDVESALQASVLVLDELGSERFPDTPAEMIFKRYDAGKQTIVTTWLDEAGIAHRYGGGIVRRLWDGMVIELRSK